MCLLVIAWQAHPRYRLIVAANRDEFHERPTAPLGKWPPPDEIVAGRDLRAGGTWLAMDRVRRFGVVTNFRELQRPAPNAPSRGHLIPDYLRAGIGAQRYLTGLEPAAARYSGFNLLLADGESLWYASNRTERFARLLRPGVYGLSNESLDTPWPKLQRVRRRFDTWLAAPGQCSTAKLFAILADRTQAGVNEELPQTGLSPEWEQLLSSPFVCHPEYGTRCSTVLLLEPAGGLYLAERRFDPQGVPSGETELQLDAGGWP
ncbi:MAG: NRDE family protein [Steroidobacteraceae bacterium]